MTSNRFVAVVLAGGASARFGADKLEAMVGGVRLIERTVRGLPATTGLIVVGPARVLDRPARFVREDPPGGGPAAALVAGLRAALEGLADLVAVLPGDAPGAGEAAGFLITALVSDDSAAAVVGVGLDGREQPLQLALRRQAAATLVAAAGPAAADGMSARLLIGALGPALHRVELTGEWVADVDTPADVARWPERSN